MSFLLFGARQTGKTSFINQMIPPSAFRIDLLKTSSFLEYSQNSTLLQARVKAWIEGLPSTEKPVLFIDEIQKVPSLLDEIHSLIEQYKTKNLQVILTGSSARKLKRTGVNLGGGRLASYSLYPFTYKELGDLFNLDEVLRYGSLAGLFFTTDSAAPSVLRHNVQEQCDILNGYVELYLKEEIKEEGLTRNIGSFARFLQLAGSTNGDLLNYSNIAREAQVQRTTVQTFYEILEDTLLGFKLEPYELSERKKMVAHAKFYLFDLGIVNALGNLLSAQFTPQYRGRLFESLLILEAFRLRGYKRSEAHLFFWRTKDGNEVDLLIEKHGTVLAAFEFKSGKAPLTKGLISFRREFPNVPLYVVAEIDSPEDHQGIKIIPWKQYLTIVGEIL